MAKDLPPQLTDMRFILKPASDDDAEKISGEIGSELDIVLRISFFGDTASNPIISGMIRTCGVDVNILYGTVDHIQGVPYGMLIVKISGEPNERSAALNYLQNFNLGLEVVGYVRRNANIAV
jgi:ABC-type methionine transport system ATPase subunit